MAREPRTPRGRRHAPLSTRIRLHAVDELHALPAFARVHPLMRRRVRRGRCEILRAINRRASRWSPDCIGPKAGSFEPPWWEPDPIVPCAAVHLFRIRDAFYVPSYGVVVSSDGEVMKRSTAEAAYLTPDLSALPRVAQGAEGTFLDLVGIQVQTIPKAAVTMPWGATQNYGHFLLDCVTGASLVRGIRALDDYPLVFPCLQGWQRRHLELVEVQPRELADPVYRVADLVFTSCMDHFLGTPNINYRTVKDRQLRNLAPTGPAPARLYVSRQSRDNRRFESEHELEEKLRAAGYAVITPEAHSVDEQIHLFQHADVVIGCTGAGMANVLYCRRDATIVEIKTPWMESRWLSWSCALMGCRWRPYFCHDVRPGEVEVIGGVPRPEARFSFDADLEDLLRFVDAVV